MAEPQELKVTVNLGSRERQTFDQIFFKWAINIGRIIIVVTELIALSALLYRFVIDRQIIDLHEQIEKEIAFIKGQEDKEKEYRSIQDRLANIKIISNETNEKINFLNEVINYISSGEFQITNLIVSQNQFTISGSTLSVFSLNSLIENLKKNPAVIAISVDEISSLDQGIDFKLSITLTESQIP